MNLHKLFRILLMWDFFNKAGQSKRIPVNLDESHLQEQARGVSEYYRNVPWQQHNLVEVG